ncbi:nucleotide sugar dehydrogenase [Halorientalis marina]|uniref:nucleotide sugar dehydrogenase n=1 Tax=Halorientalis marina TaxID=2931976 RepID=UPI001FF36ACB|nr:nucleotide sugar dehydrogenase [Halorientalis marina]
MRRLAIFGLGYVGREVASLALEREFDVVGIDTDPAVVESAREGETVRDGSSDRFEATTDGGSAVEDADGIVVTVPTPLDSSYSVDLSAIEGVADVIATGLSPDPRGTLVVLESTIPPGTVADIVVPRLQAAGYEIGDDVFLAHVPERIDPGNDEWLLAEIPRVAGARTDRGLERAVSFYDRLLDADIHPVSSTEVAAASKIIENAYRDINIAFVNEVALTLDELQIDASEALDAADTKPFGFTRFSPGAGVGGHCIPIDPYFLIERAASNGHNSRFLKAAREVNDRMPAYIAERTVDTLVRGGTLPQEATVLLLGKAFKPNVSDTRNSPYFGIRTKLESYHTSIETYDPTLPDESTVDSPYQEVDAVVLVTDHDEFRTLDLRRMSDSGVDILIDGRNVFSPEKARSAGLTYVGVGRS